MRNKTLVPKADKRLRNFMVFTVLLGIGGIIAGAVIIFITSQLRCRYYYSTYKYSGGFYIDDDVADTIIHTIGFGIGIIVIFISLFGICLALVKYYSATLKTALIEEKFSILYGFIDKDTPPISCPICGEENSAYSHFCEKCGNNLHLNNIPSYNIPSKLCPACGEENLVEAKFCANCGEEFPPPAPENKSPAPDIPKPKTETASEDTAIPSDIIVPDDTKEELVKSGILSSDTSKPEPIKKEIPKNWKCPNCGKLNGQALTKCWGCKTPRP